MTVYFALEERSGNVKIGYTSKSNVQCARIDPALTMNSSDVSVIATLPDAGVMTEQSLLRAFSAHRIYRGGKPSEFIAPCPELWALIGYVQRTRQLPCPPDGCGSIKWVPA